MFPFVVVVIYSHFFFLLLLLERFSSKANKMVSLVSKNIQCTDKLLFLSFGDRGGGVAHESSLSVGVGRFGGWGGGLVSESSKQQKVFCINQQMHQGC